ncbi:hypothetical protein [Siminovitchia sp. FSL W7-1587]|uniref:hypothetical protein n=1 Tax=Siminovitchia sp. FSL W7-1587 TaxID=2954699 RepID=UPI0030D3FCD0
MKRKELENEINSIEKKMIEYKNTLSDLRKELDILIEQEKKRRNYISSSEIVDFIFKHTGKKINMSTIKRWADEGYLGEIVEEKDKFWALERKQGKKRFLYPVIDVYHFLYEKGYLSPKYEVLDRVQITIPDGESFIGIVIDWELKQAKFLYMVQKEGSLEKFTMISEEYMKKIE